MAPGNRLETALYSVGNVFIALLLIGLVAMTRRNVPNIYKTYSMMAGLLVTIAIGFLIVLILGVVLITITFWFDKDPGNVKEVQMSTLLATTVKVEALTSTWLQRSKL